MACLYASKSYTKAEKTSNQRVDSFFPSPEKKKKKKMEGAYPLGRWLFHRDDGAGDPDVPELLLLPFLLQPLDLFVVRVVVVDHYRLMVGIVGALGHLVTLKPGPELWQLLQEGIVDYPTRRLRPGKGAVR